jgi:hypothetical protein
MRRKVRRIHWHTAKRRKPTIPKLSRIKRTAFLISLIILSDLWTIQFRLSFKGHKCLEYCCLVIHLTSVVSIISYAESIGIFVLIGRIKPEIRRSKKSIVRLIRKKTFLEKRNSENVKDYFERLVFQRPQKAFQRPQFSIRKYNFSRWFEEWYYCPCLTHKTSDKA